MFVKGKKQIPILSIVPDFGDWSFYLGLKFYKANPFEFSTTALLHL